MYYEITIVAKVEAENPMEAKQRAVEGLVQDFQDMLVLASWAKITFIKEY